jgi:hypothetical protein
MQVAAGEQCRGLIARISMISVDESWKSALMLDMIIEKKGLHD